MSSSSSSNMDPVKSLNDDSVLSKWLFEKNYCFHCGKKNSELDGLLMQCGKCRQAYYCSMKCFNADLEAHQKICNTAAYSHKEPDRTTAEHMSVSSEQSKSRHAARAAAMGMAAGLSPNKSPSKKNKLKVATPSSTKKKVNGIARSNSRTGSSSGVGGSAKKDSSSSPPTDPDRANTSKKLSPTAGNGNDEQAVIGGRDTTIPIQEILCDRRHTNNGSNKNNNNHRGMDPATSSANDLNNASATSLGNPNDASWQMSATSSFSTLDKNGDSAAAMMMSSNINQGSSKSGWTMGDISDNHDNNNGSNNNNEEYEEEGRRQTGRNTIQQEDSSRASSGRNFRIGANAAEADSQVSSRNQVLRAVELEEKQQLPKAIENLSVCSVNEEKKEFEWQKPAWSKQLGSLRKTKNGGKLRTGEDVTRPISQGVDRIDD